MLLQNCPRGSSFVPLPAESRDTRISFRSSDAAAGCFRFDSSRAELRGCIGNIHPSSPLYRTVAECAISAAVGDPRFTPLTLPELENVTFEISVLSADGSGATTSRRSRSARTAC